MADDEVGVVKSDAKANCIFCKRAAITKLVKCSVCGKELHRFCCESRGLPISGTTTKCCEVRTNEEDNETSQLQNTDMLVMEIKYLKEIIKEKDNIIKDKLSIIADKEFIIEILKNNKSPDAPSTGNKMQQNKMESITVPTGTQRSLSPANNAVKKPNPIATVSTTNKITLQEVSEACLNAEASLNSNEKVANKNTNESWSTVAAKKPRPKTNTIVGTQTSTSNLKAVPRQRFVHVYRLSPETTEEKVKEFVKPKCPEVTVQKVNSKYPKEYSSFKVGVNVENEVKVLDPDFWPAGVCASKFFQRLAERQPAT